MSYLVKIICYSVIVSAVELQFSACVSFTQEEYNIIAGSPLKLVCNIGATITNGVTVTTPDNVAVVSCTPTSTFPPSPATCSGFGGYTGSIDETANTVTVTTNTLPGDVNGTWSCAHGGSDSKIVFPNPIPCLVSENLVLSPNSLAANVTTDTTAFSLIATYSCINVDVTFKWILKAGSSYEFTSSSVSKDSSSCIDSGTCAGVNSYTQTISSDSIFQFAIAQNLLGGYELSAEAHYSNGITALKSHVIGYFEFSQSKDSCDCNYWKCIWIILAVVIIFSLGCTVMFVWKRNLIQLKAKLIVCCYEKIKWTYCCGTSVLLLEAVLITLTIATLVIWAITMLIVIFNCCASEECKVGGNVAGISFLLSLVVIMVFQVVFWIICCCIERGYIVYTIECGDKKTLLADFTQPDGIIESIEWTYQGSLVHVSFENAAGGTKECPALTLTMVSLDQSGVYVCIISCKSGDKLEQKVFHFKLLVTPKQYEVKIGDRVNLLEFLKYCQQVKRVDWTHSNNTITTKSCFYKGGDEANPVLTVNCFATSDSGLYYCRVKAGQFESTKWFSARLNIKEQQEVNQGERIVLLNRLGRPADVRSVIWTHDKRLLVSESFCSYEGGTIECPALTIPVVSPQNAGKYECKLKLNQGELRMYRVILEVKECEGNQTEDIESAEQIKVPRILPPIRMLSPSKVHPEMTT